MRAIIMMEKYYNISRTGKLIKIKSDDKDLIEKL